jgi:uncharacterized protein
MITANDGAKQAARWAILAAASLAVALGFEEAQLPASFLIGPLIAGIGVRLAGIELRVPRPIFLSAQAVVGAMIGSVLTPSIVHTFRAEWPVLGGTVVVIVVVASAAGWALSRFGVVPGTTGVWGSSPGAASAMVILSEAHGGDVRLVAFMQYLRVLFVASAASIVARVWIGASAAPKAVDPFAAVDGRTFAITMTIVVVCGIIGFLTRVPSGAMLLPLLATASLHGSGSMDFAFPPWLLILAYAGLGWTIGLGFTRNAVTHAARALPWIVVSILVLMAVSAGLAVLLVETLGIDPLTAFLATSPGGMDTVAIIAASTPVDVSFVMSLQAFRFFALILIGPTLSKWVAARLARGASHPVS